MESKARTEQFVQLLAGSQNRLYAYIRTLVHKPEEADDVLQETNLVMWRKSSDFIEGTEFGAWACKIAYYQVMAHRRDCGRDRHLFDDRLLGELAQAAESRTVDLDKRQHALKDCLSQLTDRQKELVQQRYKTGGSVKHLASSHGWTPGAVATRLYRIRRALLNCIHRKLALE